MTERQGKFPKEKKYSPIPVVDTEDGEIFAVIDLNEDDRENLRRRFEQTKEEIRKNHLEILNTIPDFRFKYSKLLNMGIEQICEYFRNEPETVFNYLLSRDV